METPTSFKHFERSGQEVQRLRPAWMSYWRAWGSALIWIGLCGLAYRSLETSAIESLLLPAAILVLPLLPLVVGVIFHRYTRSYEIENGTILRTTVGLISRVKREYELSDKVQVDAAQTVPARLLNYGNLGFWAGDDKSRMEWIAIPDPDKTVSFIRSLKALGADGRKSVETIDASEQSDREAEAADMLRSPPPTPPADVVLSDQIIALPGGAWILKRITPVQETLVKNYQWIKRGDPLLKVTIETAKADNRRYAGSEDVNEDVIIRSPATGLVLSNYMSFGSQDGDPSRLTILIWPLALDPKPETGEYIYGGLRSSIWRNRDHLFRTGKSIMERRKYGAKWANIYVEDKAISTMLDEMCSAHCVTENLYPKHEDQVSRALEMYPDLKQEASA